MWSWANESSTDADHELIWQIKDIGDCHGIERLSSAMWKATEDDSWSMAAATVSLLGGVGAYRVNHAHLWIYFALLSIEPVTLIDPPAASN
jgi:hypothetical protein